MRIDNGEKRMLDSIPFIIDEKKFNPSLSTDKYDFLILTFHKNITKSVENLANRSSTKLINFDVFSKNKLENMFELFKKYRILFIPYSKALDYNILIIITKIATLLNTTVIIDEKYSLISKSQVNCGINQLNSVIKYILNNPILIAEKLNKLQRDIYLNNSHILREIRFVNNSIKIEAPRFPQVSVVVSSYRKHLLNDMIETINYQKYVDVEIILLTHGFRLTSKEQNELNEKSRFNLKILNANSSFSLGECLNQCVVNANSNYIAKLDDDDIYGNHYLIDHYLALKYSNSDLVGKGAHFVYIEGEKCLILRESMKKNQYDEIIMGATIFGKSEVFRKLKFKKFNQSEDSDFISRANEQNYSIYQNSPFEYCVFRDSDMHNHTWKIEAKDLLKNSIKIESGEISNVINNINSDF